MRRRIGQDFAGDFLLLAPALRAVGEEIIGIARAHQARAGERERDARRVDGDPAPAPLLGDIGGRAGATGRVEHEVAGVGGHEDAAFDNRRRCLDDIDFLVAKAA